MNPTSLRRLTSEHRSLHASPLPPNYLFPTTTSSSSGIPDDLTQLSVLLAGPEGTPYSDGLWKVHLKMPEDYPRSPPKAAFRTKIWHPNVEESTGAVCVDTLKRDWRSELTMRDILVEDYEAFARHAKLMTSIHAVVPQTLREAVKEAKHRGEDPARGVNGGDDGNRSSGSQRSRNQTTLLQRSLGGGGHGREGEGQESDNDEEADDATASKENDPSLSPSPVSPLPPSPRKSGVKKRPLSTLPTPIDPDDLCDEEGGLGISASNRNIANNNSNKSSYVVDDSDGTRGSRKSPKLSEGANGVNASGRIRDDDIDDCTAAISPFPDEVMAAAQQAQQQQGLNVQIHGGGGSSSSMTTKTMTTTTTATSSTTSLLYPDGKENMTEKKDEGNNNNNNNNKLAMPMGGGGKAMTMERITSSSIGGGSNASSSSSSSRKTSSGAATGKNGKNGTKPPRIGLRRL